MGLTRACRPPEKPPPRQQDESRPGWKGSCLVPAQEGSLENLACCIVCGGLFANCQG